MTEYTVTAEEVEATIKRQLTYDQAACLKQIEEFRTDMSVAKSVTHMLKWDSAPVIAAEFSYHQHTKTLGRVGSEECSLVESIKQTQVSLERALIQNQWRGRSTSDFHNAADSATTEIASQLVTRYQDWSDQAKEHGLI